MHLFRNKSNRRGVSVMEVLFSIGIVSVGLLGVVALVPVGGHQASRGFLADFKSLYGKSAFRQLELRGMSDPQRWVWPLSNGSFESVQFQVDNSVEHPNAVDPNSSSLDPDRSYCLDPRFVARYKASTNNGNAANYFPYIPNISVTDFPHMKRITLATQKVPAGRRYIGPNPIAGPPYIPGSMPPSMADLIFQSDDDLRLDKPQDRSLPPVQWDAVTADSASGPQPWQSFESSSGQINGIDNPAKVIKRQAEGELSWLATIVPKIGTSTSGTPDDLHVLSLVVFENRELANTGSLDGVTERVVEADGFPGGGFGGGEVVLKTLATNQTTDLKNEFDDFGAGNWIMLMRNSPQGAIYRWYKVIAADEELSGANDDLRRVTLDGPDWTEDTTTPNPTYAVIMPGVVAVYEKVVRLEGSSLYEF